MSSSTCGPRFFTRLWRSAAPSEDRARQEIDSVGRRLTDAPPQDLPRERTSAVGDEFAGEHAPVEPPLVTPSHVPAPAVIVNFPDPVPVMSATVPSDLPVTVTVPVIS